MSLYCCNCYEAKCSTVSSRTTEGVPIYFLNNEGKVVHKVRCKKGRWRREGIGGEQTKTLWNLRRFRMESCLGYQPMDMADAEAHRLSLPETREDYEERWKR